MNEPKHPPRTPKLIIHPNQTSFGFVDQLEVKVAAPQKPTPVAPKDPPSKAPRSKEPASEVRIGRARARISFEVPARLKRKLARVARERDRSKTALLRAALEAFLRRPFSEEDDE